MLIFTGMLLSCNKNSKKNVQIKVQDSAQIAKRSLHNKEFENFKLKFKSLKISDISLLSNFFDKYQTSDEHSFTEVESQYKKNFLKCVDTKYIYYGYKTEVPNGNVILSFINHHGKNTAIDDPEVIDTTFVTSVIYDSSGNCLESFRTFGSNITAIPPTYNMNSTFKVKEDRLSITNYEYSTGASYEKIVKFTAGSSDADSVFSANLIITSFYIDYKTNKIITTSKIKKKTKVIESYSKSKNIYLKPID